jgi:hypothetical protein
MALPLHRTSILDVESKSKSELLNLIKICIATVDLLGWSHGGNRRRVRTRGVLGTAPTGFLPPLHTVFSWAISSLMPKINTTVFFCLYLF